MSAEALFTSAREAFPQAERIEVKYLTMRDDGPIDEGMTDWDYVVTYLGDYLDQARVTEVAIAYLRGGAIRFVYGDDVTDAAQLAVWEAENVEDGDPWAEHRLTASDYGLTRVA